MSLIVATGSNIGNKVHHLNNAKLALCEHFYLIKASDIFSSEAVDYLDQPDFFNQVLEFEIPSKHPEAVIDLLLDIEKNFGRKRDIDKGPRTLDIDIIFWGLEEINIAHKLCVPHPRWSERSFVVKPLKQLPFFQTIKKYFKIPECFEVEAYPISDKRI